MLKRKKESNKNWLLTIGFLILVVGIALIGIKVIPSFLERDNENKALDVFYNEEYKNDDESLKADTKLKSKSDGKLEYIAVLKIPKIKLEKGLVDKKSKYNSIDYGIQILKESDMPDVINGNVILAAHAGTASISVFNDLDKLDKEDIVEILYEKNIYKYKIVKIYDVPKSGEIKIDRNYNCSSLTLITCRNNTNNQIVLIGELQI